MIATDDDSFLDAFDSGLGLIREQLMDGWRANIEAYVQGAVGEGAASTYFANPDGEPYVAARRPASPGLAPHHLSLPRFSHVQSSISLCGRRCTRDARCTTGTCTTVRQ